MDIPFCVKKELANQITHWGLFIFAYGNTGRIYKGPLGGTGKTGIQVGVRIQYISYHIVLICELCECITHLKK